MSGFGPARRAHPIREHGWRHIEHLLFEWPGISGLGGSLAVAFLRDDLFRACSGADHAKALLLAAFPSDRTPVVAATARLVPFLLEPAAALGRLPPWRMKLQCLALVATFSLGVSSAVGTRLPPSTSVLASLRLPALSSIHSSVHSTIVLTPPAILFYICPGAAPCA